MEKKEIELLLSASETLSSVLLIAQFTENAIENEIPEKVWDIYPIIGAIKRLTKEALGNLREIQN